MKSPSALKKGHGAPKKGEADIEAEAGKAKLKPAANKENLDALEKALHNIRPTVEVKSRRVGGATYQVPVEVDSERGLALAMRMLTKAAKARGEKTMVLRLAAEILEAHEGRGSAVKARDDMHRMAKANQAFAHYRW
jgi:small subunit ribosomal protein S7